jgi:ATP-dependent exoDNAse (exonuclease V) beta subunit
MALASRRLVARSGKTEVVARRVADLLAGGADAGSIIAFTFTERAAAELKARISARVEERLGQARFASPDGTLGSLAKPPSLVRSPSRSTSAGAKDMLHCPA